MSYRLPVNRLYMTDALISTAGHSCKARSTHINKASTFRYEWNHRQR